MSHIASTPNSVFRRVLDLLKGIGPSLMSGKISTKSFCMVTSWLKGTYSWWDYDENSPKELWEFIPDENGNWERQKFELDKDKGTWKKKDPREKPEEKELDLTPYDEREDELYYVKNHATLYPEYIRKKTEYNNRRNKEEWANLLESLWVSAKADRHGFRVVDGWGQQEKGPDGKSVVASEPSVLLFNVSLGKASQLAKKYEQYQFIYCGTETEGQVHLLSNGDEKAENIGEVVSLTRDPRVERWIQGLESSNGWSTIKGRPFTFEKPRLLTSSYNQTMSKTRVLEALDRVNEILASKGQTATTTIIGGAAIMLHFPNFYREVKDIDGTEFSPELEVAIEEATYDLDLSEGWFNNKSDLYYDPKDETIIGLQLSNLTIMVPTKNYLLCLKIMSNRSEEKAHDPKDVEFMIHNMPNIRSDKDWQGMYYKFFGKIDWNGFCAEAAHHALEERDYKTSFISSLLQKKSAKYRETEVEGFPILIGKSAIDNDELSFSVAEPHDVWLHASGVPGSHVVIKTSGRECPREVLKRAAAYAAFYSKAKEESVVSVTYGSAGDLSKPSGAAPGEVSLKNPKIIKISPQSL